MNPSSKFWNTLSISKKSTEKEGILSFEKPFNLPKENIKVDDETIIRIETNTPLQKEDLFFVLENSIGPSGNSFVIDPKIHVNNIVIKLIDKKENILGFAVSIPCAICLKKDDSIEIIESVMTSHLCVSKEYRNKELAKYIISGIIDYGFTQSIFTGYHYIKEPKTNSNLVILNYFRPLHIENAIQFGYEIPSLTKKKTSFHLDFQPSKKQLEMLEKEYSVFPYEAYEMKPTEFLDLTFLQEQNRKISLIFSVIRFEQMRKQFEFFTIWKKDMIIGLVIYKTAILHIGKIGKGCPNAQICLLEMKPEYKDIVLSKVIHHLKEKRYVTMNGVYFGELTDTSLQRKFGMVTCGIQYLDFYNLHLELRKDCYDVNLFYY